MYDQTDPLETEIQIHLAEQRLQLMDGGGQLILESDASTGVPGHETPRGRFKVLEKLAAKRSNLYGRYVNAVTGEIVVPQAWMHVGPRPPGTIYRGIEMPYWLRVTWDGVGIHQGKFSKGRPTSHGCIRMPMEAQKLIFAKARVGTPVVIE